MSVCPSGWLLAGWLTGRLTGHPHCWLSASRSVGRSVIVYQAFAHCVLVAVQQERQELGRAVEVFAPAGIMAMSMRGAVT